MDTTTPWYFQWPIPASASRPKITSGSSRNGPRLKESSRRSRRERAWDFRSPVSWRRLLGGNVYLRSQVGIGSTFCCGSSSYVGATEAVYVPDVTARTGWLQTAGAGGRRQSRSALHLRKISERVTQFQVVPAQDLKEARRALDEFRPIAIVLDVLLQGEHSWNLLQELKQKPRDQGYPCFRRHRRGKSK